jgi:ubiquinone biosynthesis protein UbiJ
MTLTEALLIAVVGALASVLTSLATTGLQGWKWKTGEQPKSAADAAGALTDSSLALVTSYRLEVASLRKEVSDVREENQKLLSKLEELEDVKDWAERLVHQVRSLGLEPVKLRPKSNRIS